MCCLAVSICGRACGVCTARQRMSEMSSGIWRVLQWVLAAGGCALNSEQVTELGEARWGPIVHPTATQLAAMALRVSTRLAGSEPMVLWKMDLKGAFTLMLINPDSAQLLAFALTSDSGGKI